MIATHKVEAIRFNKDVLMLNIDGIELTVPLDKFSFKLNSATDIERAMYKISPSGYGIHWPLIDEDLSISGMLRDFQSY